MTTDSASRPVASRRGSTLLIVLALATLLFGLIFAATVRLQSVKEVQDFNLHGQEAAYAAEAVASMLEGKLANLSGNLDNLTKDLRTYYGNPNESFWNLRGWQPSAAEKLLPDPRGVDADKPLRFGNCVVRWRIEPVAIAADLPPANVPYAHSYADLDDGTQFTVNNAANLSDANWQAFQGLIGAGGVMDGTNQVFKDNGAFYHFRIITQACRVADPTNPDPRPWQTVADRLSMAQATRVVQLKLESLFKYVIFYAATGPTGDLDLWAGATIGIYGAVHSNGAIYLGGQGTAHIDSSNYNDAASSHNQINIGTAASPVTITGVNGIFHMRKPVNYYAALQGIGNGPPLINLTNPMAVPLSGVGPMTGFNNLNGAEDGSTYYIKINGIQFTANNDSRRAVTTATDLTSMENRFKGRARDSQLGASVVRTLSNIPELSGCPMEAVLLAPSDKVVLIRDPTLIPTVPTGITPINFAAGFKPVTIADYERLLGNLTINTSQSVGTLYYDSDPITGTAQLTSIASSWPVPSTNLPLYWQDLAKTVRDLSPVNNAYPDPLQPLSSAAGSLGYDGDGFRRNECIGYYLDRAKNGMPGSGTTGLVIRERPWPATVTPKPAQIGYIAVTNGGSGYATPPTVTVFRDANDTGCGAIATAILPSGPINGNPTVTNQGNNYTSAPTVTFVGGGAIVVATGTALIDKQVATGGSSPYTLTINTTSPGSLYTSTPTATITGNLRTGPGLQVTTVNRNAGAKTITSIVITDPGGAANPSRYTAPGPTVNFNGGGGSGAAVALTWSNTSHFNRGKVYAVNLTAPGGSGYTSAPTITFAGGGGTGAAATCGVQITDGVMGQIQKINMPYAGMGYMIPPTVRITGGGGSGATASAYLPGRPLRAATFTVTNGGTGYTSVPTVNIVSAVGGGATATATINGAGNVTSITLDGNGNGTGCGYTAAPTSVVITGGGGAGATVTATWTLSPAYLPPTGPSPEIRQNWFNYLSNQYAVYLGTVDITSQFFGQVMDPVKAPQFSDFIVSEDDFLNRREAAYLAKFYTLPGEALPAANLNDSMPISTGTQNSIPFFPAIRNFGQNPNVPYRVNTLTLNMRKVQDFLAKSLWQADILGITGSPSLQRAKNLFNGLIYVARTRRSMTYDPLMHPELAFRASTAVSGHPRIWPNTATSPYLAGEIRTPMAYNTGSSAVPLVETTDLDGDGYLGPNYPHIYREGSGGIETAHAGVRLRNGSQIDWNNDINDDGLPDKSPVLGTSGLTVITPNPMYLWGDYNRQVLTGTNVWALYTLNIVPGQVPLPIPAHKDLLPPCAIFADGVTSLSNQWKDAENQGTYNAAGYAANSYSNQQFSLGSSCQVTGDTVYHYASLVINNVPSQDWNALAEGSGAVPNVLRFLELAGGGPRAMNFLGSLVVLNEQRYGKGLLGASGTAQSFGTGFYGAPARNYYFNSDLLQSAGQPPFSPFGMEVTRVLSQVDRLH